MTLWRLVRGTLIKLRITKLVVRKLSVLFSHLRVPTFIMAWWGWASPIRWWSDHQLVLELLHVLTVLLTVFLLGRRYASLAAVMSSAWRLWLLDHSSCWGRMNLHTLNWICSAFLKSFGTNIVHLLHLSLNLCFCLCFRHTLIHENIHE